MHCMRLTESTIFFCFHSVRVCFLILCHIVITLFTILTCQCYLNTHNFPPPYYFLILRHKKKTSSIARYRITNAPLKVKENILFFLLYFIDCLTNLFYNYSNYKYLYLYYIYKTIFIVICSQHFRKEEFIC